MSIALYPTEQLRFWNKYDILLRENIIDRFVCTMEIILTSINKAWRFDRVEGPLLIPKSFVSNEYTDKDVWATNGMIGDEQVYLRAETTNSSYLYAKHLFSQKGGNFKPPLCVYQVGKSFRKESNEGASASKLRFFEFYQLEFQCIYSATTGADYVTPTIEAIRQKIEIVTNKTARIVPSERLPSYSQSTMDIEIDLGNEVWREMCSISQRNDFSNDCKVLEVALGLDRLVSVCS